MRSLDPGDARDIAALIRASGRDLAGYDIKVSGNPDLLDDFAAAGATWSGRWIPPRYADEARTIIEAGPRGATPK